MNCQDISRLVDAGNIRKLGAAERSAADSHARSCRDCAAIWGVQSRLAGVRVPATPPEVATRFHALAAITGLPARRRFARRLTVIGALVALGAAAGVWMLQSGGTPGQPAVAEVTALPATGSAPSRAPLEVAAPAVPATAPPATEEKPREPLPLLPAPVYDGAARDRITNLALQLLVERHPELVAGPATDDMFFAAIAMYEDGRVLNSIARMAPRTIESREVSAEVNRSVPTDGGNQYNTTFMKDRKLPDGQALRTDVSVRVAALANGYDATRSNLRVLQALGDKYRHLMLPAADGVMNRLTVFMGEDGHVQREHVERVGPPAGRTISAGSPTDVTFLAETIAKPLGLEVNEIGLIGTTTIEEGSVVGIVDGNGDTRVDDRRRLLMVTYAWPRRAGETQATWGQAGLAATRQEVHVDQAVALRIVEREIPDAFRSRESAAGTPTVVLAATGEVIKAGRVQFGSGGTRDQILRQLVPGIRTASMITVRVTNDRGETANVEFVWARPEAAKPTN